MKKLLLSIITKSSILPIIIIIIWFIFNISIFYKRWFNNECLDHNKIINDDILNNIVYNCWKLEEFFNQTMFQVFINYWIKLLVILLIIWFFINAKKIFTEIKKI